MIEVYPRLFVGSQLDYEQTVSKRSGWSIVHACKEPYHREALGYKGRSVEKDHPEYLVARRGDRLMLNIIDVDSPSFFCTEMIDQALDFIDDQLDLSRQVLVHCNQGESRAPAIALVYMATRLHALPDISYDAAELHFRGRYPSYHPRQGIYGHLKEHWKHYRDRGALA